MQQTLGLDAVLVHSDAVLSLEIAGGLLIVPRERGASKLEDTMVTLNDTGRALWDQLDGKRTLGEVATILSEIYSASAEEIEQAVMSMSSLLMGRELLLSVGRESR